MNIIIENNRIAATATDDYSPTGQEQAVIPVPEGFDPSRMADYVYQDGQVSIPAPPPAQLTQLEFLDRFTDAELISIREAAKAAPELELWLWRFDRADFITPTDPRTMQGVQGLEAVGLLAEGRATEILAGPIA